MHIPGCSCTEVGKGASLGVKGTVVGMPHLTQGPGLKASAAPGQQSPPAAHRGSL